MTERGNPSGGAGRQLDVVAPARSIVAAIVEDPALVRAVRELNAATLAGLVRQVGLEDSGALLALATPTQLARLADDELWRAAPGADDDFDADRFGVWLQVLLDEGRNVAADALLALDEDLLAHALAEHVYVLDLDELAPHMATGDIADADAIEKVMEASLSHELDELLLLSRRYDGWDALIDVLHELDARDHDLVRRLLERVCAATMSRVADDGLYSVLTEAETLLEDARGGRDDRRAERGFVSGADARAFLAGADRAGGRAGDDPITRAYFRHLGQARDVSAASDAAAQLVAMLRQSGAIEPRRPALPETATGASPTRALLHELREAEPERWERATAELLYLANIVMAGATFDGAPIDQFDAVTAALAFCDAGDEELAPDAGDGALVRRFGAGWRAAAASETPPAGSLREAAQRLRRRMAVDNKI